MVEFAFSAAAFGLFLIISIEMGIVCWRLVTAQYIASLTAREAAMFAGSEGAFAHPFFQPRPANVRRMRDYSYRQAFRMLGGRVGTVAEWNNNFSICAVRNVRPLTDLTAPGTCTTNFNDPNAMGDPEEFIAVRIDLPTRFFFQTMTIPIYGWAAARNEEFGS